MASFYVQHLTPARLSEIAETYLSAKHPTGELPIPIEDIIDLHEKIDIVPVEGLGDAGHEAFTARDRKTIYVDRAVFCHRNTNRLRFTLAHELGHILIHKDVFAAADYTDIDGFRRFLASIGDRQLQQIEYQAYALAGYLLVPAIKLSEQYTFFAEQLHHNGLDITSLTPDAMKHIAKKIGESFGVSGAVIHRRAVRDGLWKWDDIPDI